MKALISTFILGFVVLLSSCGSVKEISEPEFRDISGVRVIKVGLLQTTAGADLVCYNPNDFGIQLANARGDVFIDGAYFGHFDLDQKVQVKKRSEFILPVVFKLDNIGAIKQREIYKKKEAFQASKVESSADLQIWLAKQRQDLGSHLLRVFSTFPRSRGAGVGNQATQKNTNDQDR